LLPFTDKWLLGRSFILIVMIRLGLWLLPYSMVDRLLTNYSPGRDEGVNWQTVRRVVRAVRTCSRYVPYATCLTQALVARALLGMDGQPADLKIGFEKGPGEKVGAHAWIEVDGRIVIGKLPSHGRFAVLS
jgi:hypothetical protein